MLAELLLPNDQELRLESCCRTGDMITVEMTTRQSVANCPQCEATSARVHSTYQRTLADLPCTAFQLRLFWTVRRFFCDNPECERVTFVEQLPSVAARYARKTSRLAEYQTHLAYALGGRPGARLAEEHRVRVSRDTLIRLIRNAPEGENPSPTALGVDDWAFRKGQDYGTILVDLERRHPVDLLSERSAEVFADWLRKHPEVEIISRDRSHEYRKGAEEGAPQATQVADRWHLIKNLREALERHLEQQPVCLAAAGKIEKSSPEISSQITNKQDQPKKLTQAERERQIKRAKRVQRYETVRLLHKQGFSQREIAEQMQIGRQTIRKYIKSDQFPEYARRKKTKSILDPHKDYLEKRWQEGMRNASALWRELQKERGYSGGRGMVGLWAAAKRKEGKLHTEYKSADSTPAHPSPWSAKRASWLLLREESELSIADWQVLHRMCQIRPELVIAQELTHDFHKMVRQRQPEKLIPWLSKAKESNIESIQRFGQGIQQEFSAVQAALTYEWSNGQTEGQVNRLKMIKRQMYGRAKFDLLRKRFLGLSRPP